jgi:hypothetical protein
VAVQDLGLTGTMADQLQSVPACRLNISEEQYCAIGHMTLQWAFLEGEIDREIDWLNTRNTVRQNLGANFKDRVEGWRRLAEDSYAPYPVLIDGVTSIGEKAVAIKSERDKLVHCHLVADGMMIRIRQAQVLEISDQGTPVHIQDLACRISNITAQLFQHQGRLARVFDNPL